MLSIENLASAYGRIEVLHGISMEIRTGEIASLIGANGAGKTTLLRAISGVQPITSGDIRLEGRSIASLQSHARVALGISHVPEGRQLFAPLSVEDNLKLGAWSRPASEAASELARVYALFPMLAEMRRTPAGALSGGQQQMLAIGRGLMAEPKLLILDEPSLGLSPRLVEELFALIETINREGIGMLLVEQNVVQSLQVAQRAYVLDNGAIVLQGSAQDVRDNPDLKRAYLGM